MDMKKIAVLTALIACASFSRAHAATNSALTCLQASVLRGGLSGCLNESGESTSESVPVGTTASRTGTAPSLSVASLDTDGKEHESIVPTPTGFTTAKDGSLKAGFYNGLDSGFKTVFAGFEYLPILGMEACGDPYQSNVGTIAFTVVGLILSIPASIVGAVVGAPLGAVAGMIAEKVSPGSTKDWFTF